MIILACGILIGISIFLLLEPSITRRVFGLVLLGSTINIILLICGRLYSIHPVFINGKAIKMANPLPQALILTAIVIGFGLLAFLCALLKKILTKNGS
ncbi:MAG: NADH-quinone oxidoreductase subunit K [Pseudomonadota bacterium]